MCQREFLGCFCPIEFAWVTVMTSAHKSKFFLKNPWSPTCLHFSPSGNNHEMNLKDPQNARELPLKHQPEPISIQPLVCLNLFSIRPVFLTPCVIIYVYFLLYPVLCMYSSYCILYSVPCILYSFCCLSIHILLPATVLEGCQITINRTGYRIL